MSVYVNNAEIQFRIKFNILIFFSGFKVLFLSLPQKILLQWSCEVKVGETTFQRETG